MAFLFVNVLVSLGDLFRSRKSDKMYPNPDEESREVIGNKEI